MEHYMISTSQRRLSAGMRTKEKADLMEGTCREGVLEKMGVNAISLSQRHICIGLVGDVKHTVSCICFMFALCLLAAFVGALYVDKGIEWVKVFLRVCFFPRLEVRPLFVKIHRRSLNLPVIIKHKNTNGLSKF